MKTALLETKNYEGKQFFGLIFENHPETVYLNSKKLRQLALNNYKLGKTAKSYKKEYFKGLPYYTELNY